MLEGMYVIEGLHGWDAPVRAKSRLRTKPKFCAVVTATSPFCRYDAAHDVYVFPITALRP